MPRRRGERRPRKWEFLPKGEVLFRYYYVDMGAARSWGKMAKWCGETGHKNPRTGRNPVPMSIWKRAWCWALSKDNQDKAYEIYNQGMRDEGEFCTPEEWKKLLDLNALTCFGQNPQSYKRYQNGTY